MANRKAVPLEGTLEEALARAANVTPEQAADFLTRHDIHAQALIPRPVNVTVTAVRFNGVKSVHGETEPYSFEWQPLGSGLWLLGSELNSRGKTSVLAVIRWLLRGSPPGSLTDTVKGWIDHAELDFDLGGQPHRSVIQVSGGYAARLLRDPGPEEFLVIEAATPDAFASTMSDYMMTQLQLERVANRRVERRAGLPATEVEHVWPSLFSAFHIGTDYKSLLGSTSMDGLPTRMLNMFAGFKHASAVAKIQFVQSGLKLEEERASGAQRAVAAHARTRLARLEGELATLGQPDGGEAVAQAALESIRDLSARLGILYDDVAQARRAEADAKTAAEEAHDLLNADRLALRMFLDAREAAVVFRALTPSCCPRCDQRIATERLAREKSELACMVCGEEAPKAERGDAAAERANLETALEASQSADASAKKARGSASTKATQLENEIAQAELALSEQRAKQATTSASTEVRDRRAVLVALIAEAKQDSAAVGDTVPKTGEAAMAAACETVLRERLRAEQELVLLEVREEMLALLQSFGVSDLDEVELASNVHLNLKKGGASTNYGRLSVGEKLRAKIALVLALMKVAHRRGIGRHPSLLFIDTPGAQETADADLRALAAGLAALRNELPQLQIFLATTRVAEFEDAVPSQNRRVATGSDSLW